MQRPKKREKRDDDEYESRVWTLKDTWSLLRFLVDGTTAVPDSLSSIQADIILVTTATKD